MKRKHLRFGRGFRIAIGNRRSQAAEMVIAPGKAEGDRDNRHRGADQWLSSAVVREDRAPFEPAARQTIPVMFSPWR